MNVNIRVTRNQGILYVDGWCASFKMLYFFFRTLMTLSKNKYLFYKRYSLEVKKLMQIYAKTLC